VLLLAPELIPANHREVLAAATHKSKSQLEELIAALHPKPPVPSSIRKLPVATTGGSPSITGDTPTPTQSVSTASQTVSAAVRPEIVPLAPQYYKVVFTASQELRAKLEYAQNLLRHQIPDGDLAKVVEVAVTELIKSLEKKRLGATDRPHGGRGTHPRSRHIPAEVKRQVWVRDGGRCAFVARNGCRCSERGFLQFHHVVPYSVGGPATVDNIQLRCTAHNAYEAEAYFGAPRIEPEYKTIHRLGF
jgi:hypothetical protein